MSQAGQPDLNLVSAETSEAASKHIGISVMFAAWNGPRLIDFQIGLTPVSDVWLQIPLVIQLDVSWIRF